MVRVPPLLLLLLFAGLIALLARFAPLGTFLAQPALAIGLAAVGAAIALGAVREFARARTTVDPLHPENASALVTGGPFAFSRNPMYLGFLLILVAEAAWLGSVSGLIPVPLFALWVTRLQILPEEAALREKFGDAFTRYAHRTRRWI